MSASGGIQFIHCDILMCISGQRRTIGGYKWPWYCTPLDHLDGFFAQKVIQCGDFMVSLLTPWTTRWTNTSLTEWRANKWATVLIKCRLIPTSPWRHNEHDGVSNHQHHDCLLSRLFRRRSNKTSKPRMWGEFTGDRWIPHTKGQ